MNKPRVMYIVARYPQISETYIKTELDCVQSEYETMIVGLSPADISYRNHLPFESVSEVDKICELAESFRPDVLHTHWLHQARVVSQVARATNTPFTVRTHSFDVLKQQGGKRETLRKLLGSQRSGLTPRAQEAIATLQDDLCVGVLGFPFVHDRLVRAGVPEHKLFDCYPVMNYARFHDRSPNGNAIMNTGACMPKKKMEDFLELGRRMPERTFNLYALGYELDEIKRQNAEMGDPVNIKTPVEPDDMPREYKKHEWLVYTASRQMGTVGWPLALAEAQASGVGVCMQNIRPDLKEYVGDAGFLFDSVSDVASIVSKPFPQELRELGFEHARRSDIANHITILTDLWDEAARRRQPAGQR